MPDQITTSESVGVTDPRLKAIARRVLTTCILAAQKATMHSVDARGFPMAAGATLEGVFHERFMHLDVPKRSGAVARVRAHLTGGPLVRQRDLGDLARVDLHDAREVAAQVRALPFPDALRMPADALRAPRALHGPGGLIPLQPSTKVGIRVHKVRCVDETNPEWLGDDEIALGGTTVDETGDTHKVAEFMVRNDFDDNEQKVYSPPKVFTRFSLLEGTAWPKRYFVTFVLAEKDMGGLADFLNKLLDKVKSEVISALGAAIGGAIGASGGPVGAIIGAVVGWVVGQVFEWLKAWWSDDVFPPKTVSISVPSQNASWAGGKKDSAEGTLTFVGHGGTYALTYDWFLEA
jgi:hypothetical protein